MNSDDLRAPNPLRLAIAEEAQRSAMKQMADLQVTYDEFMERVQPALDAMDKITSSPGFKAALDSVAETSRIATEVMKAINLSDLEEWTKALNTFDIRPLVAESLAPSLPVPTAPLNWDDDIADENPEPLKQVTEEVVSIIQDKVTANNEKTLGKLALILRRDGALQHPEYPDRFRLLPPKLVALVTALEPYHVSTSYLTKKSGYKNEKTTRQQIQKLNNIGFGVLKLPVKIAYHEDGEVGYRLPKGLKIKAQK